MKTSGAPEDPKVTSSDLLKAMAKHPFLKGVPQPHLERLTDCSMLAEFAADQVIFREGDIANRFYLLTAGEVALETSGKEGTVVNVDTIGKGDVLGWSWLFPPYYWRFDARATKPTKAVFFYGTRLREWCEKDHDLGYHLLERVSEVIIKRLQATRARLLDSQDNR